MSTDGRRAAQEVARSAISDDVLAKLQTNPDHATYVLLSSMDAGVDALLAAGYRLVSDDTGTVERVAKAMYVNACKGQKFVKYTWEQLPWDGTGVKTQDVWRGRARAAIAALKGENQK